MSKRRTSPTQRHQFQVINFSRSPMNKKQWLCRMACGCEQWVTRSTRPILGTTRLTCEEGHAPQSDPLANGPLMLDVTESDGAR